MDQQWKEEVNRIAATMKPEETPSGKSIIEQNEERQAAFAPKHLEMCGVLEDIGAEAVRGWKDRPVWPSVQAAREFTQNERGRGLILLGAPGTGKSCAAAALLLLCRKTVSIMDFDTGKILTHWKYQPRMGLYTTVVALLAAKSWDDDDRSLWSRAKSCHWLVLDDLGIQAHNHRQWPELIDLLIARLGSDKRTIITANPAGARTEPEALEWLGKSLDGRIIDRVRDRGAIVWTGPVSMRGTKS